MATRMTNLSTKDTSVTFDTPYQFNQDGVDYSITRVGASYHPLKEARDPYFHADEELKKFPNEIQDVKIVEYPTVTDHRYLLVTIPTEYYNNAISFGKITITLRAKDISDRRRSIQYITTNLSHRILPDDPSKAEIGFDIFKE